MKATFSYGGHDDVKKSFYDCARLVGAHAQEVSDAIYDGIISNITYAVYATCTCGGVSFRVLHDAMGGSDDTVDIVVSAHETGFQAIFNKTDRYTGNPEARVLNNTSTEVAKANTGDVEVFGDPDMWVLLSKASSKSQGWMKSTKAMNVAGEGLLVQVSTKENCGVAEALQYIPGVKVTKDGTIVSMRKQ